VATAVKKFLFFMDFSARTPVADYNISSYKNPCDIYLKHVFLTEFGYGELRLLNRTKFRSDSLDIATLPEPLLLSMNQKLADVWFFI